MKPTLVVNPSSDRVFATFAAMLADHGASTIEDLQRRLRTVYPEAAVHARELVGERFVMWYVYRDGRWTDSHLATSTDERSGAHARHGAGPPVYRRLDRG